MSIVVSGVSYSHDYDGLIYNIFSDISGGRLHKDGYMYILREEKADKIPGYNIILRYYYLDSDSDFLPEPDDSPRDAAVKRRYREQFLKDKPYLLKTKVKDVLKEMNEVCSLL